MVLTEAGGGLFAPEESVGISAMIGPPCFRHGKRITKDSSASFTVAYLVCASKTDSLC